MVGDKPTVFVVDDDASVRTALLRLIRAAGYDAQANASATAYLEGVSPTPPACLVLDLRMPGMSGLELHQKARGTPYAIPTVFITGHGDEAVRRQAMALGAVAVLDKPLDQLVLLDAIRKALERGCAQGREGQ